MDTNFEYLDTFRHAAKTGHFSQSAKALHMTPSTLSRQIQRLEESLDVTLFERDSRNVTLTPEGERVLTLAESTLTNWETLRETFQNPDRPMEGLIRIACSVTASYSILPVLLTQYRQVHPNIQFHLDTIEAQQVFEKIDQGTADIGITALPDEIPESITIKPLVNIPLILIATKNSPKKIDWKTTPFIMPNLGLTRTLIEQWLDTNDIPPLDYGDVNGFEGIASLVSVGCGIGIIPQIVLDQSQLKDSIQIICPPAPLPSLPVGLCVNTSRIQLRRIQAFMDISTYK
ncbi:HTH-type transcriptional activator IlvY [bacterium]|jgi:LysR family transcriptional regulator, positive regulator for ilvC|nr:HTH-type transcriptional activator IlvY [bacterium]